MAEKVKRWLDYLRTLMEQGATDCKITSEFVAVVSALKRLNAVEVYGRDDYDIVAMRKPAVVELFARYLEKTRSIKKSEAVVKKVIATLQQ